MNIVRLVWVFLLLALPVLADQQPIVHDFETEIQDDAGKKHKQQHRIEMYIDTVEAIGEADAVAAPPCYVLSATGAWKKPVNWDVRGDEFPVPLNTMVGLINQSMNTWESAASDRRIYGFYTPGLLGFKMAQSWASFAHMSNPFLAVTIRHSQQKPNGDYEPKSWKVIYSLDHPWATDGRGDAYDFLAVSMHELGHVAGLGHPDPTNCPEETMYPGASLGETKKRSLHTGDIEGIKTLY